ncbi:MAG: type IV secretory system conjugative DNA transfer family protein [Alphaproteobacteria bacterium]
MPQFPVVKFTAVGRSFLAVCAVAALGVMTSSAVMAQSLTPDALAQALADQQAAAASAGASPFPMQQVPSTPYGQAPMGTVPGIDAMSGMGGGNYTGDILDPDSPSYKAQKLADEAKPNLSLFGLTKKKETPNPLGGIKTPPEMIHLQQVHKTHGTSPEITDDLIAKEIAIDMRRDAQREAALSYGARGGLAKRNFQILERLGGYERVLDRVFDFRPLLVKAPSGLLIEPPIVKEALDAMVITEGGIEAAVADQVLKINQQAKIVATSRNWRQYLVLNYVSEVAPPPRVLWPKNKEEQSNWNMWVKEGWDAGFLQAEASFEAGLNQLTADYNGMVRYRVLLAQGKISQPYALHEDRGVTGGGNEMRVGDRALRITGPSQFLTGGELWKPADR